MEHKLFKPHSFEEGKHAVVGDCNGFSMQERWDAETPAFAKAILDSWFKSRAGKEIYNSLTANEGIPNILDYGCGVGRLSKEILQHHTWARVVGVDASADMMQQAVAYVNDGRFSVQTPATLTQQFDIAYCVYVLQHCPAIEIREVLARIHSHLKDDGIFIYCSSDYRMAIRYDDGGFFDDRFLGVNLQEEVGRFFEYSGELFSRQVLDNNNILKTMIEGGLKHPAKIYRKKKLTDYLHNNIQTVSVESKMSDPNRTCNICRGYDSHSTTCPNGKITKLLLVNRLAPGDVLVMTNAIRDLHKSHPNKYITDVRSACNDIFTNNPYITHLDYNEQEYESINHAFTKDLTTAKLNDILVIDMQYPLIHRSGAVGAHFSEGHREYLETILDTEIQQTEITPEIYLDSSEKTWISPVTTKTGFSDKYWVINAGSKGDFTLKQYPFYQEVVNLLKDYVKFVQIGQAEHNHNPLYGAIDLRGKTNLRELFRTIYHSQGVLTCVSLPMHVAAAFKKPCVVVAGAREGTRWELYPNHQFIYVNGCLPCATYDGCWKSKHSDCINKVNDVPKCMTLITPEDVVRSIKRYYEGGILTN